MPAEDPVAICCLMLGLTIVFLRIATRALLYFDRHLHNPKGTR